MVVYLSSDREEDATRTKLLTESVFTNEKVAIGLKMFSLMRADGAELQDDQEHAELLGGKRLPRLVVLDAAGNRVGAVEGKVSATKLYGLMQKASAKTYKTRLDGFVKDYRKFLNEIDKLASAQEVFDKKLDTIARASKSQQRRWDREEDQLETRENELMQKELELLEFELRSSTRLSN